MALDTINKIPVSTRPHTDSNGIETLDIAKNKGVTLTDKRDTNELQLSPSATTANIDKEQFVMQKNPKAEGGHGAQSSSAASTADAAAAAATAKYEREATAHDDAVKTNSEVKTHNAKVDEEVKKWNDLKAAVDTLSNIKWDCVELDFAITWAEMKHIAERGASPYKEAAQLVMLNQEVMDMWPKTARGFFSMSSANLLVELQRRSNAAAGTKRDEVPVPPHPGNPPTSGGNANVGGPPTQNPPPGASPTPGGGVSPTPPPGSETTPKPPSTDSKTPALDAVPPYNSKATTGEGRLLDAIDNMQARMDALEKDMAAAGDNPALMQRLNAMYTKMNTAMSMFTQLLKQRTEMMNNMQKMYSEMAMSAIRNMR
jgi:hypothetical protein